MEVTDIDAAACTHTHALHGWYVRESTGIIVLTNKLTNRTDNSENIHSLRYGTRTPAGKDVLYAVRKQHVAVALDFCKFTKAQK